MHTALIVLLIFAATVSYFIIGGITLILMFKKDGYDWREAVQDDDDGHALVIWLWPLFLIGFVIICPLFLIRRIADITRKDHKDE